MTDFDFFAFDGSGVLILNLVIQVRILVHPRVGLAVSYRQVLQCRLVIRALGDHPLLAQYLSVLGLDLLLLVADLVVVPGIDLALIGLVTASGVLLSVGDCDDHWTLAQRLLRQSVRMI